VLQHPFALSDVEVQLRSRMAFDFAQAERMSNSDRGYSKENKKAAGRMDRPPRREA